MTALDVVDEEALPKGWTYEKLKREAYYTGNLIRKLGAQGNITFGKKEIDHMSTLIGYLVKSNDAARAALEKDDEQSG